MNFITDCNMKTIHCFCKRSAYFSLLVLMIFATKSWGQICLNLPAINGQTGTSVAPNGWNIWNSTPDMITGNGTYPGVAQAVIANVNGSSNAGGEMAFFLINAALGSNTEGLRTTLTGLTPGVEYLVAFQWQQVTLDYNAVIADPSGGKLEIHLDGSLLSTFTSSGDVNDNWQTAFKTFTATAMSHVIGIKGTNISGQNWGAIVVDNLPCGIPLSTELIAFEATPIKDAVLLSWNTNSEQNNDYFSIERSGDMLSWITIGTIDAVGNSTSNSNYSFIDDFPLRQLNYYRLKQVDVNGNSQYSEIRSVRNEDASAEAVNVFPNPSTSVLSIYGKNLDAVTMVDVTGRSLDIGSMIMATSEEGMTITTEELPSGTYFIRIGSTVKAVVKQ